MCYSPESITWVGPAWKVDGQRTEAAYNPRWPFGVSRAPRQLTNKSARSGSRGESSSGSGPSVELEAYVGFRACSDPAQASEAYQSPVRLLSLQCRISRS